MIELDSLNDVLRNNGCVAAGKVQWFEEIGSTNDYVMAMDNFHGAVCVAGLQTEGRGRRGRQWLAPAGSSILMSIGWGVTPSAASGLSLACGLGVYDALFGLGVRQLSLKWPNDVLINGMKIAGILVELGKDRAVLGIGLNVNIQQGQTQYPIGTRLPWTDLKGEGYPLTFQHVLEQLIVKICRVLQQFSETGFAPMRDRWNRHHGAHQQLIKLEGKEIVQGVVAGVDVDGALLLDLNGERRKYFAGEVSVAVSS